MRNPIPTIYEEVAALKERLQREHDGHKKPRVQMLSLLATRQARDRQEVARLLGVHRKTISRWLARYAVGGLDALLAPYLPAGKPVSLAPTVLASLAQALRRPEGFASDEALRQGVRQTHEVEVKYKTLYTLVRTRFRPSSKCRAPATQKSLRPSQPSRPPVRNSSSGRFPPRTPAPSGSLAKTKAASAS